MWGVRGSEREGSGKRGNQKGGEGMEGKSSRSPLLDSASHWRWRFALMVIAWEANACLPQHFCIKILAVGSE